VRRPYRRNGKIDRFVGLNRSCCVRSYLCAVGLERAPLDDQAAPRVIKENFCILIGKFRRRGLLRQAGRLATYPLLAKYHFPPPGWIEEFDGAVIPVLVFPIFPTALFSVLDEPGVPAGPRLLPVVPWLLALPAFAPGAPPVPFTVAPLLSVVPPVDDVPPVDEPGDPPAEPAAAPPPADAPPADPPPPPPPAALAKDEPNAKQSARASKDFFMKVILLERPIFLASVRSCWPCAIRRDVCSAARRDNATGAASCWNHSIIERFFLTNIWRTQMTNLDNQPGSDNRAGLNTRAGVNTRTPNDRTGLDNRRSGIGTGTITAVIAAVVIAGALMLFGPWGHNNRSVVNNSTPATSNSTPGTTTGQTSTPRVNPSVTPAAPATAPAPATNR
jgi:hypothetical protein